MKKSLFKLMTMAVLGAAAAAAQDSVDVVFGYNISSSTSNVSVRGEFNGWGTTPMEYQYGNLWTKTVRLRIGGAPGGKVPGAYQYKFWYGTGNGTWVNDPYNQHVNPLDNDNTFFYTKDPTICHLLPNQRNPIVTTATPTLSASIFPKVGASVDTGAIQLSIDGTVYAGLGTAFDSTIDRFSWTVPSPLANGSHTVILSASSTGGGANSDTVNFTVRSGWLQITSQGGFSTWNPTRTIRCSVADLSAHTVRVVRNGTDTLATSFSGNIYTATATLVEGVNTFRAITDSGGTIAVSPPVSYTYLVSHRPTAIVTATLNGGSVILDASGSTDPDNWSLTYTWSDDPSGPSLGLNGAPNTATASVLKPLTPGEYYFGLIVDDGHGGVDTLRSLFIVNQDGSVRNPTIADNPSWAREGRIYFLFPKSYTSTGTLNAAAQRLHYIHDLGFNIIWLMPVMKNAYPINNGVGPGYNIVDFYSVAPEYGTNQDLKRFVDTAHALDIRVVLDITPNHTSRFHPWSLDAHTYLMDSRYWTWYEHNLVTPNTNGLGDDLDASGFNYYGGFSDLLLNVNWNDIDFRTEMINTYKFWITTCGVDGYRFDVYWGPHRRYGEAAMGKPVRDALKHIKPDILLLGEDGGTGVGTEVIYADHVNTGINGGLDAAYDFNLYWGSFSNFGFSGSAINTLFANIDNSAYYPGPHALYMRYMESQDEDVIFYLNPSFSSYYDPNPATAFMKTMPMSTVLFTAPGLPMLWNGQEVGWGYGISGSKENRARSVINWSYAGASVLTPHYQRIASIRGQFPAFTQHKRDSNIDGTVNASDSADFVRVPSGNAIVFAFSRPYWNQNGLTVVNFSGSQQAATLDLTAPGAVYFSAGIQPAASYYLNELYGNTHQQVNGSALNAIPVVLPPYGVAVYTVSTTLDSLPTLNPVLNVAGEAPLPVSTALEQNYPNPFNPSTVISFRLSAARAVRLVVFDILGREVATLVNEEKPAGSYSVRFDASGLSSGVYFYQLRTGTFVQTRKLVVLK